MRSRNSLRRRALAHDVALVGLLLAIPACNPDTNQGVASVTVDAPPSRTDAPLDAEGQLYLAAELLLPSRKLIGGPGTGWPDEVSLETRAEATAIGDGVVRHLLLESGVGVDPAFSPWTARVATTNAIEDTNQNGTTRDEVMAMQRARYSFRANAAVPDGTAPGFLFPRELSGRLRGTVTGRNDAASLRLVDAPATGRQFTIGQIAMTMLSSLRSATTLLAAGRGDLYGATSENGMRGLLLLEQAVAAERCVIESLAWDGARLTSIADPAKYDPAIEPRVLPARLAHDLEAGGAPRYYVVDRGSNLIDQARFLRASAELAWLADPQQNHPRLARLFRGDPFGDPPQPSAASKKSGDGSLPQDTISWDKHIAGLLAFSCSGGQCHDPGQKNQFRVGTYEDVLKGGQNQATNPVVVKGDAASSLLWQIVALDRPPVSKRMPDGGPYMSPQEIQLIADWIDGGAVEKDDSIPDIPPAPGLDGLRVVLANLKAMHVDPKTGLCVDRSGLDAITGEGRGHVAFADSTGELLSALAAAVEARPDSTEFRPFLASQAELAVQYLLFGNGSVYESHDLVAGKPSNIHADLSATASLAAGLFDAGRVLGSKVLVEAANQIAERLLSGFSIQSLPRDYPGSQAASMTPVTAARLLAALRLWRDAGVATGGEVWSLVWRRASKQLVLAEWPESGETFGDGNPDSDDDGIPEVGTSGLPPLFAPLLQNEALRRGIGIPERRLHYSRDVLPILLVHCSECHSGAAKLGEFRLDEFDDLWRGGEWRNETTSIVPFDAESSFFYRKAVDRPPAFGGEMPEARPPLSPHAKRLIKRWIDAGAVRD